MVSRGIAELDAEDGVLPIDFSLPPAPTPWDSDEAFLDSLGLGVSFSGTLEVPSHSGSGS